MLRVNFYADINDPRPVIFPPPGPFWVTGHTKHEVATVVAYVHTKEQIKEFWPSAHGIKAKAVNEIEFRNFFRRPQWWPEGKLTLTPPDQPN